MRIILCNIFFDIRFFCNTTHRPGWLTRTVEWAIQHIVLEEQSPNESFLSTKNSFTPPLHISHISDASYMFQRIHSVYLSVVEQSQSEINDSTARPPQGNQLQTTISRHKRQQTIYAMYPTSKTAALTLSLDPPTTPGTEDQETVPEGPALKLAKYRFENMEQVNQDTFGSVFSLLAAVFTALSSQEYSKLVKPLWERFMDDRLPQSFIPTVFLLMQCGEKIPKIMTEVSTHDFYSDDPLQRLNMIQKHASLEAFRFNVLNQEYIPISSRRRPFRGDGGAFSTPFVPTDLGSNQFSLDEPRWMAKLKNASNFPIELKRQIQELGWDDDDNVEEHEALKKVLTPLSLLPSLFLEEEEDERMNEDEAPSNNLSLNRKKSADVSKIIARRKRATTVHSLTVSFLSMVDLLNDDYSGAANALRELLEHFLRDDPGLFLRSFINDLGKYKIDRHRDMLTRLRSLISMQHKLPPGFTHILFNYLAGLLKWIVRENVKDGLVLMTLVHPILAELVLSTNDLSIRDLRKNKIEHLLVSTGRFWFTHEQPANMFPRFMMDDKSSFYLLDIPPEVFSVAMLRISHVQFLTNYLIRYPREVYAVKKTLQDYEPMPIPGNLQEPKWVSEDMFYPDISKRRKRTSSTYMYHEEENLILHQVGPKEKAYRQIGQQRRDAEALSTLRARVWLRFIDNLLNGLNRNYNDRDELERILQGIGTIIIEHNNDFGIIGQALVLYTRIVTRFKRLFMSNRGYTTFIPALFKVFCEVDCFHEARSAIIFAWCRFYAVHEESFVFQMLGTLVPMILNALGKSEEAGNWMLDNMFVLMQAMHDPPNLGATSDVLGLQLQVELDDHERSVQDRIDAVSNPMAIPLSTAILKPLTRSVTTPIVPLEISTYTNRSFDFQNFIKLFLTIIAYDVGSLRAEQFVKLFRYMMPRLNRLPFLSDIIDEGMAALVDVFAKFSKHAKVALSTASSSEATATTSGGYHGVSSTSDQDTRIPGNTPRNTESAQHAYGKQWQQNDKLNVRMEFVLLVHEYFKHDGILNDVAHEKMAQIIRTVLRDYSNMKGVQIKTDWLKNYLIDCLHSMVNSRNHAKSFKKVLNIVFTQYRSQWKTMDASDLYEGLAIVLEKGQSKTVNMHDIAGFINEKFIPFGLNIATTTRANWENGMGKYERFCNALVRLIVAILENSTQDVLGEIETQTPTPSLLSYIIIPICLQYNLQWDYTNMPMSSKFRPDPTSNWMRLLYLVSRACNQAFLQKGKSSNFLFSQLASTHQDADNDFSDTRDRKQTPQSVALLFSLSFVAMKIILVRGSSSFNKLKGSWVQVAYYIKNALVFGQTLRSSKTKSDLLSSIHGNIPGTPVVPGLASYNGSSAHPLPSSPGLASPSPIDARHSSASFSFTAPLNVGTIYDFTTWRFLEFVTLYRCPLLVLLKDFIHERLLNLGSNSSHNRSSLYAPPSPRVSIPLGSNSSQPSGTTRWKSWGGDSTSPTSHTRHNSASGIIPQLNIQTTESGSRVSSSGLGLNTPNHSYRMSTISTTSSPHPIDYTDRESHYFPPSASPTKSTPGAPLPSSPMLNGNNALFGNNQQGSTVFHVLHAETITSVVNVQIAMGFKPALPWMATKRQQLKPWHNREAVRRLASEWQLLIQLYLETDSIATKSQATNASNAY
ncbi:Protein unc-80 [Choanephora cucurbitarum]|uniref:Protein unc-80 n=1 Tax=Choanephora cucurbitarum TaxID=101091 RepID=A0A1C7MXV9_9FUNG|nr:Protein unc-80 [Choanephora cucurbitarum]